MTTDSGKKPRECWGVFCEHGVHYYTTKEEAFNNSDVCITARVKFVQPTHCANCQRLEGNVKELERCAEQWMKLYDDLKSKYEPSYVSTMEYAAKLEKEWVG